MQRQTNGQRAQQSWNALETAQHQGRTMVSEPGLFRNEATAPATGSVWTQSQAQAGALNLAALTGDYSDVYSIGIQMHRFMRDGAYQPDIDNGPAKERLTDDNMAMGLNWIQSYAQTGNPDDLARAKELYPFFEKMMDPNGGLNWREGSTAHVADSIAGAQKYALLLVRASTDPAERQRYWNFSQQLDRFAETRLRVNDPTSDKYGLLLDNVDSNNETAKWKDGIFSYNQGWSIGSDVERFKITGDRRYLNRAHRTADQTLRFYAKDDGLWHQPPSFNANFFENLLALEDIDPPANGSRPYRQVLSNYLDRAWKEARDPATGTFFKGGIGYYKPGETTKNPQQVQAIDQAGMVQMFSLLAMSEQQRSTTF
jgi:hypothetical protein